MQISSSRSYRRVTLLAAGIVALSVWAAPGLAAQPATDASASIAAVNASRSEVGVQHLVQDAALDGVAATHAQRMADRDAIFHNPSVKAEADAAGVPWQWIGENVGVGPDVGSVHTGFMNSPGHRANLLYADYNTVGAGVAYASDGSVFVVHVFAYVDRSTPQPPEPQQRTEPEDATPATQAEPTSSVLAQPVVAPPVTDAPPVEDEPDTALSALTGGIVDHSVVVGG